MPMNTTKKLMLGLLRGGGDEAAPFSPADIANLALWLDASDSATLFQDDAGTTPATADDAVVGRWADKSGNARHATQTTTDKKPLLKLAVKNGRNVIRFDATDDKLAVSCPYGTSATWFFVTTPSSTTDRYIMGGDGGGGKPGILSGYSGVEYEWFNTDRYTLSASASGFNSYSVSQIDTGALIGRFNGADAFSQTATLAISGRLLVVIGSSGLVAGSGFGGDIAECLIYSSALSLSDKQSVEAYLNAKWAVY